MSSSDHQQEKFDGVPGNQASSHSKDPKNKSGGSIVAKSDTAVPGKMQNKEFSLKWSAITDVGKVRKNNEDTFLALSFDQYSLHFLGMYGDAPLGEYEFVFAVGDGMGGEKAGEFASRIAVDKIARILPAGFKQTGITSNSKHQGLLDQLYTKVHQQLTYQGQVYPDCSKMGTTLSLCWFTSKWIHFAHIGDSRIYLLPAEGGMRQISEDHTHAGYLFRKGQINEREARNHPRRNSLQKALGAGHQFIDPQIDSILLRRGDRILICSDGLTDGLWDKHLLEFLRETSSSCMCDNLAKCLVDESLDRSGRDNTTAIIVDVE